jgi:hypothetical protein
MPNLPNLSGSNIQDTYQRVLHTDGTLIYNGTGSIMSILPVTASYAISASHEITYELSSSYAETASMASSNFNVQGNITASGNISASGTISTGIGTNKMFGALQLSGLQNITDGEDYISFSANQVVEIGDPSGAVNSTVLKVDDVNSKVVVTNGAPDAFTINALNGNVTASGNISSSGDIALDRFLEFGSTIPSIKYNGGSTLFSANATQFTFGAVHVRIGDHQELKFGVDGDYKIKHINTNTPNTLQFQSGSTPVFELGAGGHITASGNISASGTITGNSIVGTIGTATQGTIDHDSLANFVAAEHYRWDTDISSTATINAANIPTLNQDTTGTAAGLSSTLAVGSGGTGTTSLTDKAILLGNGTGAVESSVHLNYANLTQVDTDEDRLVIGDSNSTKVAVYGQGGVPLEILVPFPPGNVSNTAGGDLNLKAGQSSGNAIGGSIKFFSGPAGSSGASVNGSTEIAAFDNVGNLQIDGGLSASGNITAGNVFLPGTGKISFDNSLDGTDQFISGVDNQIAIDGDNFVKVSADKFVTFYNSSAEDHFTIQHESGSIVTDYNISASGHISTSGQIYAENVYADDILYLSGISAVAISGTQLQIGNANDWTAITYGRNTDDAHLFTGAITADTRKVEISSGTDGNHKGGDVVFFGNTTSMELGKVYHLKSDSTWELADADDNTKSDGLLGVALGAASNTNGVLLRGMVTLDHDPGAIGDPLYLTTTGGITSATAPSGNGNIVRIIGYCLHASAGNIWFNPDSTFVEVSA